MLQEEALDILMMGQNVFLTGAAGSGKTYLIERYISYCHAHAIGVAITASTGIAATHIGGMTIHSWSGLGIRTALTDEDIDDIISREYISKRLDKTRVLIIDEISMLPGGFLEMLDRLLRSARFSQDPFGGIQVVLVGDFFQLPPVSRESSLVEFAFEHPIWREIRLVPCVLTTQYRQGKGEENDLLQILNEVRSGNISKKSCELLESRNTRVTTDDHTELFTRNIAVDAYNTEKLDAIGGDIWIFEMYSRGSAPLIEALKKGCLAPETLTLKVGARVMFVKNNFEAGYANGTIGHIVARHEGLPVVELPSGERVTADYMSWGVEEGGKVKAEITQIPLRLAWAITVHKSQGMTLDSAVMDLSDCFVPGQGYVALSRVRSLEGLTLHGYNEIALMIDPRVRAYDRLLSEASLRARDRLEALSEQEKKEKIESTIIRLGGSIEKRDIGEIGVKSSKLSTHAETHNLLKLGLSLEEVAVERGVKVSTIISHIEKLLEEGKDIDLEPYRPEDSERMGLVLGGFLALSTTALSPVREYLYDTYGDEYDYDEIRLARLFLEKK